MAEGYIKLHRKTLKSSVFSSEKALKVFIWCLLKATHSERDQLVGRQIVHLMPGQFVFGRAKASDELDMAPRTVYDVITTLKTNNNIVIKTNNKFSLVTIVNWALYQCEDDETNSKTNSKTNNRPTTDQHKQECKEIYKLITEPEAPKPTFRENSLKEQWRRYYDDLNVALDMRKVDKTYPYPVKPEEG